MGISESGGTGGRGFPPLGPANNIFGAAGSSGDSNLSTITAAATRVIAETTRDDYDTANAGWIDGYTDLGVHIILYYISGSGRVAQYQRRVGLVWEDVGAPIIGIKGDSGDATDFTAVGGPFHIPQIGASPTFLAGDSGLRAGNEILYFGEIDTALTMRIRRQVSNGYLFFERYDGASWNEIFQMSDSATVDIVHFTASTGPPAVPAGELCLYNQVIRDDQGTQILRPFLTDGTTIFPAIGSMPDGSVRVIQNLSAVMGDPQNVNAVYKTIAFNEDLATVAKSGSYTDLSNQPTIGVTVEDEGNPLTGLGTTLNFVGDGVAVTGVGNRKVITISSGGTPPPGPGPDDFRYGLSTQSDPALVTWAALTDVPSPTDPQTVQTGVTSAGNYFHIFSAASHDIQTIRDTVLDQIVYQDGGTGNIFTKTATARTESGVIYDAYTIGPLNANVNEEYVVAFS